MALERLMFAEAIRDNTVDNITTILGQYVVPVNPLSIEKPRMQTGNQMRTLDGRNVYQFGGYNGELRNMKWGKLPKQQVYKDMVTQLRAYRGEKLWIKERSIGTDRTTLWQPIYVLDVAVTYETAPNMRYYYASVELVFVYVPLAAYGNWDFWHSSGYPTPPQGGKQGGLYVEMQMPEE